MYGIMTMKCVIGMLLSIEAHGEMDMIVNIRAIQSCY